MHLKNGSLAFVMLGDWNKTSILLKTVAKTIFESEEIEVRVEGQGTSFQLSYKYHNVVLMPSQEKIVVIAQETDDETLELFCKCVQNYVTKVYTPEISAYGLNVDFVDDNTGEIAAFMDSINDFSPLCSMGYEIKSTSINRVIDKDGIEMHIEYSIDKTSEKIHFNEHHGNPQKGDIDVNTSRIKDFISRCKNILIGLGLSAEDE